MPRIHEKEDLAALRQNFLASVREGRIKITKIEGPHIELEGDLESARDYAKAICAKTVQLENWLLYYNDDAPKNPGLDKHMFFFEQAELGALYPVSSKDEFLINWADGILKAKDIDPETLREKD